MFKKTIILLLLCIFHFHPISLLAKELIPGGENVGITMEYEGIMVLSTYSFQANQSQYHPSKYIKSGDIIIEVSHQKVKTIHDLNTQLQKVNKEIIPITIIRNDKKIETSMYYIYDSQSHSYMSGLYLQDCMSGIGTVTFYDPDTKQFAALGHEILDQNGKSSSLLRKGTLYQSEVFSLSKAQKGIPGEKHASIYYDITLGMINQNQALGIYGTYLNAPSKNAMEVGTPKVGPAKIYTVLHKNKIEVFDIEITNIHATKEKSLSIHIIDDRLIQKTGGIIQGMSGSPILQNGKLVGAVTHVLVNDPTRGYGIFIENMLEAAK